MQTIVVSLFFAAAVWYLYRRFTRIFKSGQPSCGCGGCGGCSTRPPDNEKSDLSS